MKRKFIQNLREIIGWITILIFSYLYLFEINYISFLENRTKAFDFLVILTIMILVWLRINRKNDNKL